MKLKLVIVDDAPFIREILKHIFTNTEIDVVGEARDGEEALEIVQQTQPDVILMDIVMPRKSGIDASMDIMKKWPKTKIIACSTVDQNTMVMRALEAGCVDYLTKPFKAQDVLNVVRKALSSSPQKGV
jgi:two-component system chemotaxis response regulator CheY